MSASCGDDRKTVAEEDGANGSDNGSSDGSVSIGQILGSRWRVRRRVGKGTFSEIYEASDLLQERGEDGRHPHVAVKVAREGQKRSMLLHEQEVLKGLQDCSAIARFVELGRDANCHYIVMQLLGENLSNMRRLTPAKRLSLHSVVLLGMQICSAIQQMHDVGFIHRDIKPSNCCVGLHDERTCFLLDFGLARRWRLNNGKAREARATAEFRGTCRYASVHSHRHEELSRRDDMWSLLYMLLELHGAQLPWSATRDHDAVLQLKEQQLTELLMMPSNGESFVTAGVELPSVFLDIVKHLDALDFADAPDYAFIHASLESLVVGAQQPHAPQLDWAAEGISRDMRHILRHCAGRDGTTEERSGVQPAPPKIGRGTCQNSCSVGNSIAPAPPPGPTLPPLPSQGSVLSGASSSSRITCVPQGVPPGWPVLHDTGAHAATPSRTRPPEPEVIATSSAVVVAGLPAGRDVSWICSTFNAWCGVHFALDGNSRPCVVVRGGGEALIHFADVANAQRAIRQISGRNGLTLRPMCPSDRPEAQPPTHPLPQAPPHAPPNAPPLLAAMPPRGHGAPPMLSLAASSKPGTGSQAGAMDGGCGAKDERGVGCAIAGRGGVGARWTAEKGEPNVIAPMISTHSVGGGGTDWSLHASRARKENPSREDGHKVLRGGRDGGARRSRPAAQLQHSSSSSSGGASPPPPAPSASASQPSAASASQPSAASTQLFTQPPRQCATNKGASGGGGVSGAAVTQLKLACTLPWDPHQVPLPPPPRATGVPASTVRLSEGAAEWPTEVVESGHPCGTRPSEAANAVARESATQLAEVAAKAENGGVAVAATTFSPQFALTPVVNIDGESSPDGKASCGRKDTRSASDTSAEPEADASLAVEAAFAVREAGASLSDGCRKGARKKPRQNELAALLNPFDGSEDTGVLLQRIGLGGRNARRGSGIAGAPAFPSPDPDAAIQTTLLPSAAEERSDGVVGVKRKVSGSARELASLVESTAVFSGLSTDVALMQQLSGRAPRTARLVATANMSDIAKRSKGRATEPKLTVQEGFALESICSGGVRDADGDGRCAVTGAADAIDTTNALNSSVEPAAFADQGKGNEHNALTAEDEWLESGHKWLGLRVRRFGDDGEASDGTIVKWMPESGEDAALWHMRHDDDDEEDLEAYEVRAARNWLRHNLTVDPGEPDLEAYGREEEEALVPGGG